MIDNRENKKSLLFISDLNINHQNINIINKLKRVLKQFNNKTQVINIGNLVSDENNCDESI